MGYRVEFLPPAEKQFDKLDRQIRERIILAVVRLAENPRPHGCKQLTRHPRFRLRIGGRRVLYTVDDAARRVRVHEVGHRREVYR